MCGCCVQARLLHPDVQPTKAEAEHSERRCGLHKLAAPLLCGRERRLLTAGGWVTHSFQEVTAAYDTLSRQQADGAETRWGLSSAPGDESVPLSGVGLSDGGLSLTRGARAVDRGAAASAAQGPAMSARWAAARRWRVRRRGGTLVVGEA